MSGSSTSPVEDITKAPSTQDIFGFRPIPGISPGAEFNQVNRYQQQADIKARSDLEQQVRQSQDIDEVYRRELLLQFRRSDTSTSDLAAKFNEYINPEGTLFKNLQAKRERIKQSADQPGVNAQSLLIQSAPQNDLLGLGGSR